ncbi:AraC family transcriptional regulator [Bowmanella denitrificans]|uniref:AraC family transcriptional regulator n=1 Tax=Bowmanella denitrificans TaxID=366582 RepID=A0ABN0X8F4_9ALTE
MSRDIHTDRINRVIRYIENNLDADLDVDRLADIACYSKFHFHRLFCAAFGEGVYAFKKRLLLERSVKHLLHSSDSLTEIAFKCGYDNQASFHKAFKKQFCCTPSQVRKLVVHIGNHAIQPIPTRSIDMQPDIVELPDMPVICARAFGTYAQAAPQAWAKIMKFAYSNRLMNSQVRLFGIPRDDPNLTQPDRIRYDACLDINADLGGTTDVSQHVIEGGRYLKFLHRGAHEKLSETYTSIFHQWLPESNYKLRDVPVFELYLNRDPRKTKPQNLKTEIYIPVE